MNLLFLAFLLSFTVGFSLEPSAALERLKEGNLRYKKDELLHPNHSSARREEVLQEQHPFATIVGCSDSRVSPEIIFDQGIGDLFIVRVAGNVVGPIELDSIEYSIKILGSSLVLIMGHESCGAVTAVVKGQTEDIEAVASLIQPAIKKTKNIVEATKANVRFIVANLKKNPFFKSLIAEGKIDVVGVYYHLNSGSIEILK